MQNYLPYFNLKDWPFTLAPRVEDFFAAATHERVLATVADAQARHDAGIVFMTAPGAGKTLLSLVAAKRQMDAGHVVCYVNARSFSPGSLVASLAEALGIDYDSSADPLHDMEIVALALAEKSRGVFMIVDDASLLPLEALKELQVISSLAGNNARLVTLALFDGDGLPRLLKHRDFRALRSRLLYFSLPPLSRTETEGYIRYRLWHASEAAEAEPIFTDKAMNSVAPRARGNPSLINLVCDRALEAAMFAGHKQVSPRDVAIALKIEPFLAPFLRQRRDRALLAGLVAFLTATNIILFYLMARG